MDGCMDGWTNGWMDEWMDGSMTQFYILFNSILSYQDDERTIMKGSVQRNPIYG